MEYDNDRIHQVATDPLTHSFVRMLGMTESPKIWVSILKILLSHEPVN